MKHFSLILFSVLGLSVCTSISNATAPLEETGSPQSKMIQSPPVDKDDFAWLRGLRHDTTVTLGGAKWRVYLPPDPVNLKPNDIEKLELSMSRTVFTDWPYLCQIEATLKDGDRDCLALYHIQE